MLTRVTAWINYRDAELRIDRKDYADALSDIAMRHERIIVQTTEAKIRQGLIALGWTPPPEEVSDVNPAL